MNNYGFFEGCLKATKMKFQELLNTPRARGVQYETEKLEIVNQIINARDFGELTQEQANYLISEFGGINFGMISLARKELKRKKKKRFINE